MKTPEDIVKDNVTKYLRDNHIWFRRYQAQYNANGLPDLDFLYKGIYVGCELKAAKGKPTDLQKRKLGSIVENGGIGIIARCVDDVDKVIKYIDNLKKGKIVLDFKDNEYYNND